MRIFCQGKSKLLYAVAVACVLCLALPAHALSPLRAVERGRSSLSDTIKTIQECMKEAGFEGCLILTGSTVDAKPDADLDLFMRWNDYYYMREVEEEGAKYMTPDIADIVHKLNASLVTSSVNYKHIIHSFDPDGTHGIPMHSQINFNEFFKYNKIYVIYPDRYFVLQATTGLEEFKEFLRTGDIALISHHTTLATMPRPSPAAGCL